MARDGWTKSAVAGLVTGAILGFALSYLIGFTAIAFVPHQDYVPEYAIIPFLVGIVLGPLLAVRRMRTRKRRRAEDV